VTNGISMFYRPEKLSTFEPNQSINKKSNDTNFISQASGVGRKKSSPSKTNRNHKAKIKDLEKVICPTIAKSERSD
jgi:hypothetical protein